MTTKMSISFSPPDISEKEIEEVIRALRSGWITTGPRTKEFEKRLGKLFGSRPRMLSCFPNGLCGDGFADSGGWSRR